MKQLNSFLIILAFITSCGGKKETQSPRTEIQKKLDTYVRVSLDADLSRLPENYQQMIPLLIEAARIMDDLFWEQALSTSKTEFLAGIADSNLRTYAEINYGPWDRLDGNTPFIEGFGPKPAGANYYPFDMDTTEFNQLADTLKKSEYTLIRRNSDRSLKVVHYHEAFAEKLTQAADLLRRAAELADEPGLKKYLELRATALTTGNYYESDVAWMEMKNNPVDIVIGPIEHYEDQLYGYKAAFEAYVLVKDMAWSKRLDKFAAFLPELQKGLPVAHNYKMEMPGTDADLNAYDAIYYAGDCNAGSKTIAINLPNDERIQLKMGTRRLQLKNTMRAKFDKILVPIAGELIDETQLQHITFDAFFSTVMFHEVAHGLGIKNTINGKGTVRDALKEHFAALEEGKADILGLYMITQLFEKGELEGSLEDYYVTFMAGIFRSVRFGASSAHGKANMIRFNFFREKGAFERIETTGKYRVNFEKMRQAMTGLSNLILTLQGDGNYDGVAKLVGEMGIIGPELQKDLESLKKANIPVDIIFDQGKRILPD
jgi:hypothetical protein